MDGGTYKIPDIQYTPEKIFANKVPALDANFISPKDWTTEAGVDPSTGAKMNERSVARQLHEVIAKWYIALRNLSVVGLLSVLLYVGIRMVISSTASDKSKYKQMLMDWIIALCLVFFLHYIMSFTLTITEAIAENIGLSNNIVVNIVDNDDTNSDNDVAFRTDLTGLVRLQVQRKDLGTRLIYLIFYIALMVYTLVYTWKYIKRAITMAFLTLIAPLVALTYPIDKLNDGKAQAFNMWLKEFVFNALLQPFHLIVYAIFLGASYQIAVQNPIYAILFLAFMGPSEKLLRKFFGFDKAATVGALDSAAKMLGGGAAYKMLSDVIKGGSKGRSGKSGSSGSSNIRTRRPIEDNNNPEGVEAFANNRSGGALQEGNGPIRTNGGQRPGTVPVEQGQQPIGLNPTDDQREREDEETPISDQGIDTRAPNLEGIRGDLEQQRDEQQRDEQPPRLNQQPQLQQAQGQQPETQEEIPNGQNNRNRTWTEDDTRGVGRWVLDNARDKWNNGQLKEKITGSTLYRKVGNGVSSVRQKAIRLKDWGERTTNRIPKPIRNSARGVFAVAKKAGVSGVKFAGRTAVKLGAAATLGAVGVGMGIAGNDLEDVLTYGAGGAILGGTAGANLITNTAGGIARGARSIRDTYSEAAYGVNAAQIQRQTKEFVKDKEAREYFSQEFAKDNGGQRLHGEKLDEVMQKGAYYNNSGITDLSKIKKSIKLEKSIKEEFDSNNAMNDVTDEQKAKMAREQAATIAKIADSVDEKKLRTDEKYRNGLQASFRRGLKKVDAGMSDREVDDRSKDMMKLLMKYKKID